MVSNKENWNVIYVKSRAEKKVNELLKAQGVETFLPLIKEIRQWSDRKKNVELPLISSYVFVKSNKKKYTVILNTPGVVSFVKYLGKNAIVSDDEINNLKIISSNNSNDFKIINTEYCKGDRVRLNVGKFKGVVGIVCSENKNNLIVDIKELSISFKIEISKHNVVKI